MKNSCQKFYRDNAFNDISNNASYIFYFPSSSKFSSSYSVAYIWIYSRWTSIHYARLDLYTKQSNHAYLSCNVHWG